MDILPSRSWHVIVRQFRVPAQVGEETACTTGAVDHGGKWTYSFDVNFVDEKLSSFSATSPVRHQDMADGQQYRTHKQSHLRRGEPVTAAAEHIRCLNRYNQQRSYRTNGRDSQWVNWEFRVWRKEKAGAGSGNGVSDGAEREADNRAAGSRASATAKSIGAEKNIKEMIMVIRKNKVLNPLKALLLLSSFKNPMVVVSFGSKVKEVAGFDRRRRMK
ncbi:hypothetical protein E3N88_03395 [Mikania micrantha]|uniref:Uncharacterized protein n=1 Tax=Mikania micrantha TaxID=192012 RepID=A0A5N6Q6J5_9ASTR|nr:hypothetical protein E3N88_03395 [Mikania micrantha]